MAAPQGNKFWESRVSHGRNFKYEDEDTLWSACVEYFEWVESNPLIEMKPFAYQGYIKQEPVQKMRAMTLSGLYLFLGIAESTWANYRDNEDLMGVTTRVEDVIRDQKFTGAAADLLNANIIARDLGLSDKKDLTSSDGSMSPKTMDDYYKQD